MTSVIPDFDKKRYRLGQLCKRKHDWHGTGMSLRRNIYKGGCVECRKGYEIARRPVRKKRAESSYKEVILTYVVAAGGCWEWIGYKRPSGYGQVYVEGRMQEAHRISYEQIWGPIPKKLDIHHTCANPSCIRPDHLEAVTKPDHQTFHGRLARSEANEIRFLHAIGVSAPDLARNFSVSTETIRRIIKRAVWK